MLKQRKLKKQRKKNRMNELKLSLHNFQSISDGELIFKTGLNFIIGQSNSGKSATFRALKACLLNPKGSQRFIKKETDKAEVTLYYNGNEIEWDRTVKESNYVINGQKFYRTGSSNAFKILNDEGGFARDDEGTIMNLEEELQLPFPFGMSGADLFKLFENVFCVSDSAVILKSAKDYEKGVESEISSLELESQKINVKLRELEDFKSFVDLDKLKRYKKGLEQKDKRLQLLADGMDVIAKAIKLDESNLEVKEQDFKDLFSPYLAALECRNVLTQTKALHALGKCIQELSYTGTDLRVRYKELKGLMKLVNQLNGLEGLVVREDSFSSKMSSYENLIQLNKTLQVLKKLNSIKVNEKTFSSKYEEYRRLRELLSSVRKIEATISQLEKDKKREEERIGSIEAKLKEFKVCPLCHHSLEENE